MAFKGELVNLAKLDLVGRWQWAPGGPELRKKIIVALTKGEEWWDLLKTVPGGFHRSDEIGNDRDLRGFDMSGLDLRKALLNRADCSWSNLTGCNLKGVTLSYIKLCESNMSEVNLEKAQLSGANLDSASLRKANARNAVIAGCRLTAVDLSDANLEKADLTGADLRNANLTNCCLNGVLADFAGFAYASGTSVTAAKGSFKKSNWYKALLPGIVLDGSDLTEA